MTACGGGGSDVASAVGSDGSIARESPGSSVAVDASGAGAAAPSGRSGSVTSVQRVLTTTPQIERFDLATQRYSATKLHVGAAYKLSYDDFDQHPVHDNANLHSPA